MKNNNFKWIPTWQEDPPIMQGRIKEFQQRGETESIPVLIYTPEDGILIASQRKNITNYNVYWYTKMDYTILNDEDVTHWGYLPDEPSE